MDQFSKSKKKSSILNELNLVDTSSKKVKNDNNIDNDGYGYMLPLLKNLKSQSLESESPPESINAVIFFSCFSRILIILFLILLKFSRRHRRFSNKVK